MIAEDDLDVEIAHPRDLDLSASVGPTNSSTSPEPTSWGRLRPELQKRISALAELTSQQLREEWRRLYRSQPPRLSRDLLIRTIAYRMQELAYGGLSKATTRKLLIAAKELETNGSIACDAGVRPGTRLVREWHGKLHTVTVTQEGFDYAGQRYASLSKIAHAITGAHWSGPRFFGLNRRSSGPAIGDGGRLP
jgi:Protein of unknown function (DUF2924)